MNVPLPALDWLRRYDRTWLRGDVVAGITLAAYFLPAGLGDAKWAILKRAVPSNLYC
jgi:SulP family sulfate permease